MKKKCILIAMLVFLCTCCTVYGLNNSNREEAYRRDFKGEGTVVAVIDGGADIRHPDLKITDEEEAKLSRDEVEKIIAEKGLKGKYVNAKIPYVRDYCNGDNDIFSKDEHGLHVAGIVGANGKIKGVAPETQLLLMKVFPDFGVNKTVENSKYYVQAIYDAIELKADVINLSLGTGAGTENLLDNEAKKAIKKATQRGIVVNIAAGNNGYFGFMQAMPKSDNPDYGVTSMPAIMPESIAVASLENETTGGTVIVSNGKIYPYKSAYKDSLSMAGNLPYAKEVPLTDVGYATEDECSKQDLEGTIAIAKAGKVRFREMQKNAARNKAAGMIIYNDENDDKELIELDGSEFSIPVVTMTYGPATEVIKNAKKNKNIVFLQEEVSYLNANAGKMSDFSAWGITNEGVLKPDITAPGGEIQSLGNHGTYVRMSGTSMATPYISGVAALTAQRLNETFDEELEGEKKYKLIKKILMSTAQKQEDDKTPISPRKQGTGVVDIKGAVSSQVVAYIDEKKVNSNLGNVSDKLEIPVTLENLSNKRVNLEGQYTILADKVKNNRFTMTSKIVKDGNVNSISLAPKEKKMLKYEIDIKDIDLSREMKNGYFLDGFITYNYGSNKPTASVAFTAFKGNFNKLPSIETPIYDIPGFDATYRDDFSYSNDFTHFGSGILSNQEEKHIVLGERADSVIGNRKFDKNHIAISPNGDNKADYLDFSLTALRTYEKLQLDILDENHHLVDTFVQTKQLEFLKNYYGGNPSNKKALTLWKYAPKDAAEGKYFARVTVQQFFGNKGSEQTFEYPFFIDNTPPTIVESDQSGDYLTIKCKDNLSGVHGVKVLRGEKEIKADKEGRYNIKGIQKNHIRILIKDYAYNEFVTTLK